jgi:hypothetical protein
MYFAGEDDGATPARGRFAVPVGARIALVMAVIGTIGLGVVPGPFTHLADDAKPVLVAASGR